MLTSTWRQWALPAFIAALAVADGVLHLWLDVLFFGGNLLANSMSVLFALNFLGFAGLAGLVLLAPRWLGSWQWLVDGLLMGYTLATVVAWFNHGSPNPMGLGYFDKGLEMVLLGGLLVHLRHAWPRRTLNAPVTA